MILSDRILYTIENRYIRFKGLDGLCLQLSQELVAPADEVKSTVLQLIKDGEIFESSKGKYSTLKMLGYKKCQISGTSKGYCFAEILDSDEEDIFIAEKNSMGALNRDIVIVKILKSTPKSPEGKVVKILRRESDQLVGTYHTYRSYGIVYPDDIKINKNIYIYRGNSLNAKEGDKVVVSVTNFHGKGNLKVYYSLRSLISCSGELIRMAAARAREQGTMLQAHMNEYPGEINYYMERKQMRPYEYLEKLGILDEHFLGAHSLILSEREMELIQERGAVLCHCPFSNCGKAVPDTPKLLEMGIPVGLGTDGAAHGGLSLWNEMKIFRSVMNICKGVPQRNPHIMPAATILKMVLEGGAAALGETGSLGRLEAGYKADLISIDLRQPHLMPTGNLINTLLEIVTGPDVRDVIVGGRVIMENREIKTLDEEKILHEAERRGSEV